MVHPDLGWLEFPSPRLYTEKIIGLKEPHEIVTRFTGNSTWKVLGPFWVLDEHLLFSQESSDLPRLFPGGLQALGDVQRPCQSRRVRNDFIFSFPLSF